MNQGHLILREFKKRDFNEIYHRSLPLNTCSADATSILPRIRAVHLRISFIYTFGVYGDLFHRFDFLPTKVISNSNISPTASNNVYSRSNSQVSAVLSAGSKSKPLPSKPSHVATMVMKSNILNVSLTTSPFDVRSKSLSRLLAIPQVKPARWRVTQKTVRYTEKQRKQDLFFFRFLSTRKKKKGWDTDQKFLTRARSEAIQGRRSFIYSVNLIYWILRG